MSDLDVVHTIEPQDWMVDERTVYVMRTLCQKGMRSLFVGGCVRHAVCGLEVQDIDIATQFKPEQVIALCEDAGIKTILTGIDHGTITAVYESRSFEITTLRHDLETDGRHAVVGYTEDWGEDARRRDFTMNTLLMDLDGRVFDPLGSGLADLQAGRVVFVGDADARIQEDYLRILRFFRFFALYGAGAMGEAALAACKVYAGQIKTLSKERVTQELFKLLGAAHPGVVLDAMFAQGVLLELAFLDDFKGFDRFCALQADYNVVSLAGRLCALTRASNEYLDILYEHLIIPKAIQKEVKAIQIAIHSAPKAFDEQALKVFLYHHGRDAALQALLWCGADKEERNIVQAIDFVSNCEVPVFPVTGADLMAQGYPSGPELGRELRRLEEEWIESGFDDSSIID